MGRGARPLQRMTPHEQEHLRSVAAAARGQNASSYTELLVDREIPGQRTDEVARLLGVALDAADVQTLRARTLAALAGQDLRSDAAEAVRAVRRAYRGSAAALLAERCAAQGHQIISRLTGGDLPTESFLRRTPPPPDADLWTDVLVRKWALISVMPPTSWRQTFADHYGWRPPRWRGPSEPPATSSGQSLGHDGAQALLAAGV